MKHSSSATTAVARYSRPEKAATLAVEVRQLALERFYVLLVGFDTVLVGLKPLEDPRVVALVAAAHRFLLGERLARPHEILLLRDQLLLEDLALAAFRVRAVAGGLARETRARLRLGRGRRGRDVDLRGDELRSEERRVGKECN